MVNKYVINLERAKDRLESYPDYIRWEAIDGSQLNKDNLIIDKMSSPYNLKNYKEHLGKCGCYLSHTNLWRHIVENKIDNVLIIEDDAEQVSDFPDFNNLPKDSLTYLGGFIHPKLMRSKANSIEVVSKEGVNKIDKDKFRVLCMLSYYIPTYQVAERLLSEIQNDWIHKKYRAIDIMISKFKQDMYYYYPAVFIEKHIESNIRKNKNQHPDKYYKFISQK